MRIHYFKTKLFVIFLCGYLMPQHIVIPVAHATSKDWNPHSYWHHPWGVSGVHKGIDIFAKHGTPVHASASGIVIFKGQLTRGGNVVAILGPKWRIHYYAHLSEIDTGWLNWSGSGEKIGRVGTTGNAAGKPAHLHYSIVRLIPNIGEITTEQQGWKRMFYVNPSKALS